MQSLYPVRDGQETLVGYIQMRTIKYPAHLGAKAKERGRVKNLREQICDFLGDNTVVIDETPVPQHDVESMKAICGDELQLFQEDVR